MSNTPNPSPLAQEQTRAAGEALARAFSNDPLCVYTRPDPDARIAQFTCQHPASARGSV
jgi:hypothetical protein